MTAVRIRTCLVCCYFEPLQITNHYSLQNDSHIMKHGYQRQLYGGGHRVLLEPLIPLINRDQEKDFIIANGDFR